ncbi:MAG: PKD domain-containing protein, partial [Ginsengibacter sp.]
MNKFLLTFLLSIFSFIANSQTVDFTNSTSNGLYCNPSIVDFTPTASGSPTGYVWNFGNGTITNDQNPEVVFDQPGTYNVKLIVVYKNNAVAITKPIVINPVVKASVTTDRNFICTPGGITFTATATGNFDTYYWDFGDSSGIVSGPQNVITHNFSVKQAYNVTLKVVDSTGCYDTATTKVALTDPTVIGSLTPTNGCIPASVTLNSTAIIPPNSSVVSYNWDFGDGNTSSTPGKTANHIYTATGGYNPSVMITTSEGCTGSYKFSNIGFGTPPTNHVAFSEKAVICGSDSAIFHSKANLANSYLWIFGDGTSTTV